MLCADTPGIWHSCVTLIVIPGPAVSIDFIGRRRLPTLRGV
jgi:hypothetical protein